MFGKKEEKDKRFTVEVIEETLSYSLYKIKDKETGVSYFMNNEGGISPILDLDGKPYIEAE